MTGQNGWYFLFFFMKSLGAEHEQCGLREMAEGNDRKTGTTRLAQLTTFGWEERGGSKS